LLCYQQRGYFLRDGVIKILNGIKMMRKGSSNRLSRQQPGLAGWIWIGIIYLLIQILKTFNHIEFNTQCDISAVISISANDAAKVGVN
jgi:hypothetical protein